jgi:hypothetical protein
MKLTRGGHRIADNYLPKYSSGAVSCADLLHFFFVALLSLRVW